MRHLSHKGKPRIVIDPGEYYVTDRDEIISTLLGSCVAACLWDPVSRIIGMNHFLLAHNRQESREALLISEAGRYGIHAMELLINAMLKKGASKSRLQAKVFGGGNVLPIETDEQRFFNIGEVNSLFIRAFLKNEGIRLQASSLGGDYGRIIHFTASDFSVYMKRIETRKQELLEQERNYLQRQLRITAAEKQRASSVQIW